MAKPGETQGCAPKGMKNSQAKGSVSDESLESSNEVAPKKQPITTVRVIFQVKMTERRTNLRLFCAFLLSKISSSIILMSEKEECLYYPFRNAAS